MSSPPVRPLNPAMDPSGEKIHLCKTAKHSSPQDDSAAQNLRKPAKHYSSQQDDSAVQHFRKRAKHHSSQRDDSAAQHMLPENMFPASFEGNVVHRMKKYSKDTKLMDKAHNFELMHLSDQQPKLLTNNWEDARKVECTRQNVGGETESENTQDVPYGRPLKGERTSLSPVFQITASIADCETDPLGLDGWNFRHLRYLESQMYSPPLDVVPVLSRAGDIQCDWSSSQRYRCGDRRQTLCQRHLSLHGQVKNEPMDEKTIKDISVFFDFDAI